MTADVGKVCRDCGKPIEYLTDFPGPRCLPCWRPIGNREALTMTAGNLARMWGAR